MLASSKETPCVSRFSFALFGSHSNRSTRYPSELHYSTLANVRQSGQILVMPNMNGTDILQLFNNVCPPRHYTPASPLILSTHYYHLKTKLWTTGRSARQLPVAYRHVFFEKPQKLRFVTSGCHVSLSLLVVTPPCHFDRRAENRENLMRPGSPLRGMKRSWPGPFQLVSRKPALLFDN